MLAEWEGEETDDDEDDGGVAIGSSDSFSILSEESEEEVKYQQYEKKKQHDGKKKKKSFRESIIQIIQTDRELILRTTSHCNLASSSTKQPPPFPDIVISRDIRVCCVVRGALRTCQE